MVYSMITPNNCEAIGLTFYHVIILSIFLVNGWVFEPVTMYHNEVDLLY